MTTLENRPKTALLVIDVQRGVMDAAYQRKEVLANIATLVAKARADDTPVIWVQHSSDELPTGSPQWEYVPELQMADHEPVVDKVHGDSFEDTDLEEQLARAGVGRVVVAGAQSDACIRSTIHGAYVRGYDVTLVADAHTTEDLSEYGAPTPDLVVAHTNMYWGFMSATGKVAEVADTADVAF